MDTHTYVKVKPLLSPRQSRGFSLFNKINPSTTQHELVMQAELEVIKTQLHGVVTGFDLMGYDPWEISSKNENNGTYALWENYDQLQNTSTETVIKKYLAMQEFQ